MRKHQTSWPILILLALLLTLGGCGPKKAVETQEKEIIPVVVAAAAKGSMVETTQIFGKVVPVEEISIMPKIGGKVTKVFANIGDTVKKGQLLISLDPTDIENQLAQAEAGLKMAESRLTQYTGDGSGENAARRQAELNLKLAREGLARTEKLFKEGAVAQAQLDAAKAQVAAAELQYEATMQNLETAKAQVNQAQAAVNTAQTALSNTAITAPISGLVAARTVDEGEMAAPSMPAITVINIDDVYVDAQITPSEISYIKPQDTVAVAIESLKKTVEGRVETVSPAPDPRTRTYLVRIRLKNQDHLLKPGMFARVSLILQKKENVVTVPEEAVVQKGDQSFVYVVKDGKAVERPVTVGLLAEGRAEIVEGVAAGEPVIVEGQFFVQNGSPVEPVTKGARQ